MAKTKESYTAPNGAVYEIEVKSTWLKGYRARFTHQGNHKEIYTIWANDVIILSDCIECLKDIISKKNS